MQNRELKKNEGNDISFSSEKIKGNAIGGKNIFTTLLQRKKHLLKTEILIEKEKHLFDIATIEKQILDILKKQNTNLTTGNIGCFVNVKQSKNIYKIAFVCIAG